MVAPSDAAQWGVDSLTIASPTIGLEALFQCNTELAPGQTLTLTPSMSNTGTSTVATTSTMQTEMIGISYIHAYCAMYTYTVFFPRWLVLVGMATSLIKVATSPT